MRAEEGGAAGCRPPPEHGPVHVTAIRVRYGETDCMGVVYHANYLVYFEVGRTELLRELGRAYSELEAGGLTLVVVEARLRFHAPARYDDELLVETRITEVTAVRVVFEYAVRLRAEGRALVTGSTVLASVDGKGKPSRLSAELREALRQVAEPPRK